MMENVITISSPWDMYYLGKANELCLISDYEVLSKINSNGKIVIFEAKMNYYIHEALMFLEKFIPYCHDVSDPGILASWIERNETVEIKVTKGVGQIRLENSNETVKELYYESPKNALCTNETGLRFLSDHGAKMVSLRAEFFEYYKIDTKKREELLDFACCHFETVFFRLYDNSEPDKKGPTILPSERSRGMSYVRNNVEYYVYQMRLAQKYLNKYGNVNLLVPFVKHEKEVEEISNIIKEYFSGNITLMIETPMMIMRFKNYCKKIPAFVIGMADLSALIGGMERSSIEFVEDIQKSIIELICDYIIPNLSDGQKLYITSDNVYKKVKAFANNCKKGQIEYLAKF